MNTQMENQEERRERGKPETLRLRGIAPGLTVGDLEASIAWYRDVVGFHLEDTWEHEGQLRGAEFVAGSAHLMLSQDDWAKGRDRVKGVGFSMYFSTAQDVDQVAADIKARGGTLAMEPADTSWGARAISLTDPDGFKIMIASASADER